MGRPKAEVVVAGTRLLDRAIAALHDGGCEPVIAVVRDATAVSGADAVVNSDPERGMRSSLQLAVDASAGCDALAVILVDMPGVGADAIRAVVDASRPGRIVVARYPDGRRGHPIVMDRNLWREALERADADAGARVLMRIKPYLIDAIAVSGNAADMDTPADLDRWSGG